MQQKYTNKEMLGDQESVKAKPEEVFCSGSASSREEYHSIQKHTKKIEIIYLTNFIEFIFFINLYQLFHMCILAVLMK